MAEKKKHNLIAADDSAVKKPAAKKPAAKPAEPETETEVKPAKPAGAAEGKAGAKKYRIIAVVLWVAAIAFEILAILLLCGKLNWTFMSTLGLVIIFLILDLACCVIGSQLWKKSNRLDPASEKNKVKFWLWNNMGLIVTAFAFIPFIILAFTNKNADKKTKTIAIIVAIIALLIGGLCGYDWNPVSQEDKEEAMEEYSDSCVYWTPFGHVYHLSEDCGSLNHSDNVYYGTVEKAIESNKTRVCSFCEKKYAEDPNYGTSLEEAGVEKSADGENEDETENETEEVGFEIDG